MDTKPQIRCDENHIYFHGSVRVYGFTEICRSAGIINTDYFTEGGRDEGTALHQWLYFLAQGKTTNDAPDPRIAGRVEAIRKFLRESKFQMAGGETPIYHPALQFATTPDMYGALGSWTAVIDAKGGAKQKWHPLQTAAQKIALTAIGFQAQKRYSLYLKDGDYRLVEHDDRGDEERWKAIVAAHHAKTHYV